MADTPGSPCLRTSPALCHPLEGVTIKLSSNRSQRPKFQCLDLESGRTPEWYEAEALISLGAYTMPSTLGQPSGGGACFLSAILEETAPERYCLSPKACAGILRRAERRGKELPPLLRMALEQRAGELWKS